MRCKDLSITDYLASLDLAAQHLRKASQTLKRLGRSASFCKWDCLDAANVVDGIIEGGSGSSLSLRHIRAGVEANASKRKRKRRSHSNQVREA